MIVPLNIHRGNKQLKLGMERKLVLKLLSANHAKKKKKSHSKWLWLINGLEGWLLAVCLDTMVSLGANDSQWLSALSCARRWRLSWSGKRTWELGGSWHLEDTFSHDAPNLRQKEYEYSGVLTWNTGRLRKTTIYFSLTCDGENGGRKGEGKKIAIYWVLMWQT